MNKYLFQAEKLSFSLPDLSRKPAFGKAPMIDIIKFVDFEIFKGEVLGIVGSSGSGKSTLGRMLTRLYEPTGGKLLFHGSDITHMSAEDLRPLRRNLQMIFQDPMSSLNPRHTILQIISAPLKINGESNIRQKVDEAMEHVGLPRSFLKRYPHELSGGQRQRVGIARAVAIRPEFILADEIISGLDVSTQAQVLNLLQNLVNELHLTVAFISHDLSAIRRFCERVMVLHQGEIVEIESSQTLFEHPKTECTKELLAAIPLPEPDDQWFDEVDISP